MNPELFRLLYFDLTQGNRIGAQFILRKFGVMKGGMILARVKWRESFDNPFREVNKKKQPTANQLLSQRQMAPLVIFYRVLQESGHSKEESLQYCRELSMEVAVAFLQYNIPTIRRSRIEGRSAAQQMRWLNRLAGRFFNAETRTEIRDGDEMCIDIPVCHFAGYSRQLGHPELGPLFCESDRLYFETFQKDVDFRRTQTLAIDGKPCDFRFSWKKD